MYVEPVGSRRALSGDEVTIPGKDKEINFSRLRGDISSAISREILGTEGGFKSLLDVEKIADQLKKGGRVFLTENDEYLFVDPLEVNTTRN